MSDHIGAGEPDLSEFPTFGKNTDAKVFDCEGYIYALHTARHECLVTCGNETVSGPRHSAHAQVLNAVTLLEIPMCQRLPHEGVRPDLRDPGWSRYAFEARDDAAPGRLDGSGKLQGRDVGAAEGLIGNLAEIRAVEQCFGCEVAALIECNASDPPERGLGSASECAVADLLQRRWRCKLNDGELQATAKGTRGHVHYVEYKSVRCSEEHSKGREGINDEGIDGQVY
jgi:hypothetical protein